MMSKDLIQFLEQFDPEAQISVVASSIGGKKEVVTTYDISYEINEFDEPVLTIQIEDKLLKNN
jgi:hypothetical protein